MTPKKRHLQENVCQMMIREMANNCRNVPFDRIGACHGLKASIVARPAYQQAKAAGWSDQKIFNHIADRVTSCDTRSDPWSTPTGEFLQNIAGTVISGFSGITGGDPAYGGGFVPDDTPPPEKNYTGYYVGGGALLAAFLIYQLR